MRRTVVISVAMTLALALSGGAALAAVLSGTEGDDAIEGTAGEDVITGLGGEDLIALRSRGRRRGVGRSR
jgi:Ca2+-binding RTX toxin-like protein